MERSLVACLALVAQVALAAESSEDILAYDGGRFVLRGAPPGECVVALQGRVTRDSKFKFDDVIARSAAIGCAKPPLLMLESPGGDLFDGILLGQDVRAKGLKTVARYDCASACALIFLGGVERVLWGSRARLGFHQAATIRGQTKWCDVQRDSPGVIRIRRYLRTVVPANADEIMAIIMQTSCESIEWVDGRRAVGLGAATSLEAEGIDLFGPREKR